MQYFTGKTILVTGATGLIGSNLIYELMKQNNVKVIALSRSEEKIKIVFSDYLDNLNFKYIAQDVAECINLENDTIDICFHAAGSVEGKVISNYPIDIIMPNLLGTKNCCDFLINQKKNIGKDARLVLFSSVTVYSNNTENDIIVNELDTQITDYLSSPNACYSQSKRMIEVIAQSYKKQYDLDIVISRFSTVYGSTKSIPDTAFFEFIKKAVSGKDILINNSSMPRRDNIYIDDAVNAIMTICEKGESGEVYNVSSNGEKGNYLAVDEIAKTICDISNDLYQRDASNKILVLFKEEPHSRKPGLSLNNKKLHSLGWELKTDFRTGFLNTLKKISI